MDIYRHDLFYLLGFVLGSRLVSLSLCKFDRGRNEEGGKGYGVFYAGERGVGGGVDSTNPSFTHQSNKHINPTTY